MVLRKMNKRWRRDKIFIYWTDHSHGNEKFEQSLMISEDRYIMPQSMVARAGYFFLT